MTTSKGSLRSSNRPLERLNLLRTQDISDYAKDPCGKIKISVCSVIPTDLNMPQKQLLTDKMDPVTQHEGSQTHPVSWYIQGWNLESADDGCSYLQGIHQWIKHQEQASRAFPMKTLGAPNRPLGTSAPLLRAVARKTHGAGEKDGTPVHHLAA